MREEQIARSLQWNRENPERHAAAKARHREKTRSLCAERSRKWRMANPGRTAAMDDWARKHPDVLREYRVKRRSAVGVASAQQITARFEMFGNRCWLCGSSGADSVDHVIPISRGGTNWPSNLRPACRRCNSAKGNKLIYAKPEAA